MREAAAINKALPRNVIPYFTAFEILAAVVMFAIPANRQALAEK